MSRRDARETAFKMVFEYSFNKTENVDVLEEYTAEMDADDTAYVKEVYFGVTSHYDELIEKISATSVSLNGTNSTCLIPYIYLLSQIYV